MLPEQLSTQFSQDVISEKGFEWIKTHPNISYACHTHMQVLASLLLV